MKPNIQSSDYHGNLVRDSAQLVKWHTCTPSSKVVEPDLPIVDAHHHLFGSTEDKFRYRLEDLAQDISVGHRIIGTVYCEAYNSGWREAGPEALRPVGEVEKIVRLTRESQPAQHGRCQIAAGIISHADMTLGEGVIEVLEGQLAAGCGKLRGARHRTATDSGAVGSFIENRPRPHLMEENAFRRGVAQLNHFGLSFDAWIYHTQMDEFISFVDALPDTLIVLDHLGGPIGVAEYRARRTEVFTQWKTQLRELARRPNVVLKLGGMGMPVFGFGFENRTAPPGISDLVQAWKPYIDAGIDAFGTSRCMFESNFPVDKQSCTYTDLWNSFKLCTRDLSHHERRDLFYRTACRTYRLPELEQQAEKSLVDAHELPRPPI